VSTVLIRNVPEAIKASLRLQASQNKRSMEEEARQIFQAALGKAALPEPTLSFAEKVHGRFAKLGGVDLQIPPRTPMWIPNFDSHFDKLS
jgi:plasmid stability protein